MPCKKDICFELLGESASNKINCVPSSNNTITQTVELPEDVEEQLFQQIKASSYYSLQIDESADITNMAILLVYVQYEHTYDVREEMLCSIELTSNTTGAAIFEALDKYLAEQGLDWKCCTGVCTDRAAAMAGVYSGVVARIKDVAHYSKPTHCIIHHEMLTMKKISVELNSVLSEVDKIINSVKFNALNSCLCPLICEDMGSLHQQLLQHTELHWLSQGKVLS
jgi:hypothetical protein